MKTNKTQQAMCIGNILCVTAQAFGVELQECKINEPTFLLINPTEINDDNNPFKHR